MKTHKKNKFRLEKFIIFVITFIFLMVYVRRMYLMSNFCVSFWRYIIFLLHLPRNSMVSFLTPPNILPCFCFSTDFFQFQTS